MSAVWIARGGGAFDLEDGGEVIATARRLRTEAPSRYRVGIRGVYVITDREGFDAAMEMVAGALAHGGDAEPIELQPRSLHRVASVD